MRQNVGGCAMVDLVDSPESSTSLLGPPEESFEEKYNKRSEFSFSLVSAVLIHVLAGSALVLLLIHFVGAEKDNSNVNVSLVQLVGLDDKGVGESGSVSEGDESRFKSDAIPDTGPVSMKDPIRLPEVRKKQTTFGDPADRLPILDAGDASI